MHRRDFLKCLGAVGVGASLLIPNPAAAADAEINVGLTYEAVATDIDDV